MNLNQSIFRVCRNAWAVVLFTVLQIHSAQAQRETHGGEILVHQGRLTLRDRIDDTNVFCKTGPEVFAEAPGVAAILDRAAKLNWYVKRSYELEINRMVFCFGEANLLKINAEDSDSEFKAFSATKHTLTVARRQGDVVYVNRAHFEKLKREAPQTYSELLIHEATHGMVPEKAMTRNTKVRSFTHVLIQLLDAHAPLLSADNFALQMKVNLITISKNYQVLNRYRLPLSRAFNVELTLSERFRNAQRSILALTELQLEDQYLLQSLLNEANLRGDPAHFFHFAMTSDDADLLRKMLKLGANPNQQVSGRTAIQYAIYFNLPKLFTVLVEDQNTDLSGALELAYDLKRMAFFAVISEESRVILPAFALKRILEDGRPEYLELILTEPAVFNSVGGSAYLDLVLPILAKSFTKSAREKAFQENFVRPLRFDPIELLKYAIHRDFAVSLRGFLTHDIDRLLTIRNEDGDNAIDSAVRIGDLPLLSLILQSKTYSAEEMNPLTGNTYLQTAVLYGQVAIVQVLLKDSRTKIDQKNASGQTALDLAIRFKHSEIAKILKSAGSGK